MADYISTTETAKLIRAQLKRIFPATRFSVRSDKYSGGSSINISWTDGPTSAAVDKIVKPFAGAGFDGMIDMKYHSDAYLLPDGSAVMAGTRGTEGSAGSVPKVHQMMPAVEGARRVRFGADYVFTSREISPAHQAWAKARWAAMTENERAAWMQRTLAWQALDRRLVGGWRYDATLFDFGADADQVFNSLARRTAAPVRP